MTLKQFIAQWLGNQADWDGYFGYQCVDLFRFYCDQVLGIPQPGPLGNAGAVNFWHNYPNDPNLNGSFDRIANTPAGVPNYGDVIVWSNVANGLGHIAIFLSGDATSFDSLDQNWGQAKVEKVHHNYKNVLGWLRPKNQAPIGNP
jgi:hypothetical protein